MALNGQLTLEDQEISNQKEDAIKIANATMIVGMAHFDQVDKSGEPYVYHCMRVALRVREQGGTITQQAAALLHDVVEDTAFSLNDIRTMLGDDVAKLVEVMTHADKRTYAKYIEDVAKVPEARLIKLADIADNLNRIESLENPDHDMLQARYLKAKAYLENA